MIIPILAVLISTQTLSSKSGLQYGPWKFQPTGAVAEGFASNVFYEDAQPKFDFPTSGEVSVKGLLENSHIKFAQNIFFPFEIYPRYSKQTSWNPGGKLNVIYNPTENGTVSADYSYIYNSDPALTSQTGRYRFHDHRGKIEGKFEGISGHFLVARNQYKAAFDHLSRTVFDIGLLIESELFPETKLGLGFDARTLRYDQTGLFDYNSSDSRWLDIFASLDGTVVRDAHLQAQIGVQLADSTSQKMIYEPMIKLSITEKAGKSDKISLGLSSKLADTRYSSHMRETSLYFHSDQVFFDSFLLVTDAEYTIRNFTRPKRLDHFVGFKLRLDYSWKYRFIPFAQLSMKLNQADTLGNTLILGDDRFASYLRADFIVGIQARY